MGAHCISAYRQLNITHAGRNAKHGTLPTRARRTQETNTTPYFIDKETCLRQRATPAFIARAPAETKSNMLEHDITGALFSFIKLIEGQPSSARCKARHNANIQ